MADLSQVTGFEWDEGNARKNEQHGVSMAEAEQVFFNSPLLVLPDARHSETEPRFHALGKTNEGRRLQYLFAERRRPVHPGDISQRHAPEGARDL